MAYENKGYDKKNIWVWILIYIVIAAVLYWAIYYFFFSKNNSVYTNNQTNTVQQQKVKFSDTAESQYAYLISTDNYDAKTKSALSGFTVDRKILTDGTQQIDLTAKNPEYKNQSYTVKPGQKLYFIERLLADDVGGQDANVSDDSAILVDSDGYVVQ